MMWQACFKSGKAAMKVKVMKTYRLLKVVR